MLKDFGVAALLAVGLSTAVTAQSASDVVATVGDTEITLGHLIITRAQLPPRYDQFPDEVLFDGILTQLVDQQVFADSLTTPPARVGLAMDNELRSLLAGEAINILSQEAVTEEAIAAAYAARVDGVEPVTEWNASHLLVETEEEAAAARARVDAGEAFADVARDVSTGPSGPSGGELGWFGPGQMVAPFEAALVVMEVGDVSGPVQTQFGWHIVTLNDMRERPLPGLEDMRPEIMQELQQQAVEAALAELSEGVEIVMPEPGAFDPAIIGNLELLEPGAE